MRTPYAMRTMMDEISTVIEDALFETQDPDGWDVWRTLVLDVPTTQALSPLLRILRDQRIHSIAYRGSDRRCYLTFVPDPRADDPKPFGLDAGYRIMHEPKE